jgi:uncharacterized protein YceK
MKLRVFRVIVALVTLLLAAGCASIFRDEGPSDGNQLPWNTPASWEGQGIGMPY